MKKNKKNGRVMLLSTLPVLQWEKIVNMISTELLEPGFLYLAYS